MPLQLIHSPKSEEDLDAFSDYLATESVVLAHRFFDAVAKTANQLTDMPFMGVKRHYNNARLAEMRMIAVDGFPNHLIYYIPTDTEIFIVRILHGARDIDAIFSE